MRTGDTIPDFSLINSEGKEISLSNLLKTEKLVLLFFPLAFSSVCTDEMCTIRDNMKLYDSLNATVAAVSVDSFFTLKEFKKANNLNFILLSDFNKEVSAKFGVLYDDYYGMKGVSKRAAFIIDKNQKLEYTEILEDSGNLPNFTAIRNHLLK